MCLVFAQHPLSFLFHAIHGSLFMVCIVCVVATHGSSHFCFTFFVCCWSFERLRAGVWWQISKFLPEAEVATVTTWSRTALLHNNRAGIKGWRGFCFCHTSKMLLSLHYSPRSQKLYFFFFVFYTPARHLSDTWLLCHLCHIWQLVVARTEHLAHNARSLLTQASDGGTQSPMW